MLILAPEWDEAPQEEWLTSALRNSAYVYPDHGRLWLTQRVLRQQGAIRMPQSARLLIESVYGEGIAIPDGLAKAEQAQLAKYYRDRAFAHQMLLNFKPGYSPDSSDFLADKLSTRLAEESITLWLAKNVDGQLLPYACARASVGNEHAAGAEAGGVNTKLNSRSWLKAAAAVVCTTASKPGFRRVVIIVTDSPDCGYSGQ